MRDALLVAELATLIERLRDQRDLRCVLWFRYFTDALDAATRVDTTEAARSAITSIAATTRTGNTDITQALIASLEQVRDACASEADLAGAQVVLVSDGEDEVDDAARGHPHSPSRQRPERPAPVRTARRPSAKEA